MSAIEALGNFATGNVFGGIKSLMEESPEENIREAVIDVLDPHKEEDVEKNMQKLMEELQRTGGDREKLSEVDGLMKELAEGKADMKSTMEQILLIVGPKDAEKKGITPTNAGGKSGCIEF